MPELELSNCDNFYISETDLDLLLKHSQTLGLMMNDSGTQPEELYEMKIPLTIDICTKHNFTNYLVFLKSDGQIKSFEVQPINHDSNIIDEYNFLDQILSVSKIADHLNDDQTIQNIKKLLYYEFETVSGGDGEAPKKVIWILKNFKELFKEETSLILTKLFRESIHLENLDLFKYITKNYKDDIPIELVYDAYETIDKSSKIGRYFHQEYKKRMENAPTDFWDSETWLSVTSIFDDL